MTVGDIVRMHNWNWKNVNCIVTEVLISSSGRTGVRLFGKGKELLGIYSPRGMTKMKVTEI